MDFSKLTELYERKGMTSETCQYCEESVELVAKEGIHLCPSCYAEIKACSMCESMECSKCEFKANNVTYECYDGEFTVSKKIASKILDEFFDIDIETFATKQSIEQYQQFHMKLVEIIENKDILDYMME